MDPKPHWLADHEREDDLRFQSIAEKLDEVIRTLRPISDTYSTASRLGKWGMATLVFFSIVIGVLVGLKNLVR